MADNGRNPVKYKLFYVIGDVDSAKSKSELRNAGIFVSLHPVDDNDRVRLERDFGISTFPALVSNRTCFTGLAAIQGFVEKKRRG